MSRKQHTHGAFSFPKTITHWGKKVNIDVPNIVNSIYTKVKYDTYEKGFTIFWHPQPNKSNKSNKHPNFFSTQRKHFLNLFSKNQLFVLTEKNWFFSLKKILILSWKTNFTFSKKKFLILSWKNFLRLSPNEKKFLLTKKQRIFMLKLMSVNKVFNLLYLL